MRASLVFFLAAALVAAAERPLPVPFLHQGRNGCGAASAAMLFHYWADQQPQHASFRPSVPEAMADLGVSDTRGVTLAALRRYFEEHGYQAFTVRASAPDLERNLAKGRPLLTPLRNKADGPMHYVVVTGLGQGRVWLHDPARRKPGVIGWERFDRMWEQAGRWILLAAPRDGASR
jgi:ABC-type bacteriocin/lantibiotic exporter with double-glycine peptidase domain